MTRKKKKQRISTSPFVEVISGPKQSFRGIMGQNCPGLKVSGPLIHFCEFGTI